MPIKPERLLPGQFVGIICPASAPADPKAINHCVEAVERFGFKPFLGKNARRRNGFLAGTDRERAEDLMRMFANRQVSGIFCVRGGYGTSRLLHRLDFAAIRKNPKILVGYSDITSLHCALLKKSNLASFHGPMLASDLIKKDLPQFTAKSFLKTISEATPAGSICADYAESQTVRIVRRGTASGPLIGGNLSLLCATLGTPYQPSLRGAILFLEDLDEPPYRFDRMLTHLLNAGLLQKVAGIAVGINTGCIDPRAKQTSEYRQSLDDVIQERLGKLGVPVVSGLPFGHLPTNATLPFGLRATLNANKGDLILEESGVR